LDYTVCELRTVGSQHVRLKVSSIGLEPALRIRSRSLRNIATETATSCTHRHLVEAITLN